MSTKRYPRKIQQAINAATQLEQQLTNPPAEPPTPAPTPTPPPEPVPAAPPARPEPAPQPPPTEDANYWKQRFSTTEGVLRAERDKHVDELKARDKQIADLQSQVVQLQQQIDAGRDPAADLDIKEYFSESQIEQLGEEYLRGVLRGVLRANHASLQKAIDQTVAPLRKELETQRQTAAETQNSQAKTAYDSFLSELTKLVPTWEQVNSDPRFGQYLKAIDDTSGFSRQEILLAAEKRLDHARVARVFSDFLKTLGALPTGHDPQRRLQPEGAPAGGDPPPDNRPSITEAEIRQFQQDVSRGRYRGREAERAAMQKRIDEAYMAGRVK